jgi:hypothetical protein
MNWHFCQSFNSLRSAVIRSAEREVIMASQLSRTAPPAKHANVQPIAATPELPSAVPLMALSTGFWAFKTLAAAHELDLVSRLAGGAVIGRKP